MPITAPTSARVGRTPLKLMHEKRENHSTLMEKLTNCAATVPAAEPATPRSSAKMSTASSTILTEMGITQMSRE